MNNELSINSEKSEISLETNKSDYAASALKSVIGATPYIGSLLSEVVGVVIPNQKIDRIKLFVEVFADKVKYIEEDVLRLKMKSEEFTDLFEDALLQAARSLTDERREYIASFLKNSITDDELSHTGEKKLLSLLNELSDVEIIFLKYESLRGSQQEKFYHQHEEVLKPIPASIGSPASEHDKVYLRRSYQAKLQELNLLEPVFKTPRKGEAPELDGKTGTLKVNYRRISGLGSLFLRYIDQGENETDE